MYLSVRFDKFLEKLFWRTSPSNYFSYDVFFFLFADQLGFQRKINTFGGAMVNQGNEFTSRSILFIYGHQVEIELSSYHRTYTHLGIIIAGKAERKKKLTKIVSLW